MALIYHITDGVAWAVAQAVGVVTAPSLATEGFIHCSRADQLLKVADRFFPSTGGLWALAIDGAAVAGLVYEGPRGLADPFAEEVFPHVYGTIPVTAVVATAELCIQEDGKHGWPDGLPRDDAAARPG